MQAAAAFLLVFARVAALVFTAPIFGSKAVTIKQRTLIAAILSVVSFSALPMGNSALPLDTQLIVPLASEIMIGVSLGLGSLIIFSAAQMAGGVLGQLSGMQFFDQLDPVSGNQSSAVGQLFGLTSLATFALMNGPEMVVGSLLRTFTTLPSGTVLAEQNLLGLMPQVLQQSFVLTISGVAPGIAAIMITSFTFGFVCRSFPQINLTSIALGSNLLMMFLAMSLTLGGCVWLFLDDLGPTLDQIGSFLNESVSQAALRQP